MQRPGSRLFLSSRIARRTLLLFVLCALIPITLLTVQSVQKINELFIHQVQEELNNSAKDYGLILHERIQFIERHASNAFNLLNTLEDTRKQTVLENLELPHIQHVEYGQLSRGFLEKLLHQEISPALFNSILQPGNNSTLVVVPESPSPEVWLLNSIIIQGETRLIALMVDSDYFWENLDEYDLGKIFSIYDQDQELIYTSNSEQTLLYAEELERLQIHPGVWNLYLNDSYRGSSWTIESKLNDPGILHARNSFTYISLTTGLFTILIATLIGSWTIRRFTAPIDALKQGIEKIQNSDFSHRVMIKSNDEFEELGDTFNIMSIKLGQHISAIKSLSEIDKLILDHIKLEDIISIVISRGSALLQSDELNFLVRNEQRNIFSLYSSKFPEQSSQVSLPEDELAKLHYPGQVKLLSELQVSPAFINFIAADPWVYSTLIGPENQPRACLFLQFHKQPDQEAVNLINSFSDHIAVAMTNADWEAKLFDQANFDTLTGLPNRYYFNQQLSTSIEQAGTTQQNISLVIVNIDNFKSYNDILGHEFADQVLLEISRRITNTVKHQASVYRLGGDEFIIIGIFDTLTRQQLTTHSANLAEDIRLETRRPFLVNEKPIECTVSIGIALYPFDTKSPQRLLEYAENALRESKKIQKNCYHFYSQIDNKSYQQDVQFISEIRRAIIEDELELYYQPKVSLEDGSIKGCEALIRWNHPEKGLLSPYFFIPRVEELGLINEIGRWIIRSATGQQALWLKNGIHTGKLAINVSALQLGNDDFHEEFLNILDLSGCPGDALEIEITETAYVDDMNNFRKHMESLSKAGLCFSVDDYGTGYSSLSLLLNLPISSLKIDKSFIDNIETSQLSYAIVDSTVTLARRVGLEVIAEGVENPEQLHKVRQCDCSIVQGYYFSRPVPAGEFEKMMVPGYFSGRLKSGGLSVSTRKKTSSNARLYSAKH